eukprot:TRINITY_DN4795_c0_g1_i1.p1 TRINITY_DN4795_c0_g1~~TRINITY_DN4795_c0_g1_i1.p1  ORF type:complete len:511 (-),score=9.96 TRINITY_DN4795_c0_g1_i1:121-1653(-)
MEGIRAATIFVVCLTRVAFLCLTSHALPILHQDSWTNIQDVTKPSGPFLPLLSQLANGEGTGKLPNVTSEQVWNRNLPSVLFSYYWLVIQSVVIRFHVPIRVFLGSDGGAVHDSTHSLKETSRVQSVDSKTGLFRPSIWQASKDEIESQGLESSLSQTSGVITWPRRTAFLTRTRFSRWHFLGSGQNLYQKNKNEFAQQNRSARSLEEKRSDPLYSEEMNAAYAAQGRFAWEPAPEKFLYLFCGYGQSSNRIRCFQNSATLAGLLNRTLLVNFNQSEIANQYNRSLYFDLDHFRKCMGAKTVMTFAEYGEQYHTNPLVDQVVCLSPFKACPDFPKGSNELLRYANYDGWEFDNIASVSLVKRILERNLNLSTIINLGRGEVAASRILFLGDSFGAGIVDDIGGGKNVFSLGGMFGFYGGDLPLQRAPECPRGYVISMHHDLYRVAAVFIEEMLENRPFLAAHLRRGDFAILHKSSPVTNALACLRRHMEEFNLKTLFLATDAHGADVSSL